jgi:hypothetical protein
MIKRIYDDQTGCIFNPEDTEKCIVSDLPCCPSCGSDQTIGMTTVGQSVLSCLDCNKVFGPIDLDPQPKHP